jgi:general secretion pathway protein C
MIVRDDSLMGTRRRLLLKLRQRAPQVAAFLTAMLVVVDVAHSAWALRSSANMRAADPVSLVETPARRDGPDSLQIVNAHLFGARPVERSAAGDPGNGPDTRLALALSGIIAVKDSDQGFAILGEQGKPAHLYFTGAVVAGTSARLYRVFADRVVLERQGELETLRLPRSTVVGLVSSRPVAAGNLQTSEAGTPARPADASAAALYDRNHPSPAQGLFNTIGSEQNNVDGRLAGLIVHPPKYIQRRYGLQDGDLLTAVNGMQINDPEALADMLRTAGPALSLTFTRDGIQQTRTLRLNN